jgi:uncharacterized protein
MRLLRIGAATVVAASVLAHAQMPGQGITVSKDNRTIAITATDSVIALADVATVHVGFQVYGVDHDATYAAGSKASNAIVSALKGAGVPQNAIESQNQNLREVQPFERQNFTDAEKAARHFVLDQSWTVRTNATDAARVLDVAVKAGANQSGQIDWSLKDENGPQAAAAGKALQRARAVAEEMAKGLNVKLGTLIFASNETQGAPVQPVMAKMDRAMSTVTVTAQPLAINGRQIEKSATVYAVFAID